MNFDKMKLNIRYKVTKGNDTFAVGDVITKTIDSSNKVFLENHTFGGWLDEKDGLAEGVEGMECEVHKEWISKKIKSLQEEIKRLEQAVDSN